MLDRFKGKDGISHLISSLLEQEIIENVNLAKELAKTVVLQEIKINEKIITQNATDNDLYFILLGSFNIVVNNRTVASRISGQQIGEMALIDPTSKRSATVIAREHSVVAKVSEIHFTKIAKKYPELWRKIALVVSDRLRQRNDFIKVPNSHPVIFIGSSKESLNVAKAIEANLVSNGFEIKLWSNNFFEPSKFPLENLELTCTMADFSLLVFSQDDTVISRGKKSLSPRDNVIFELGLFMGSLTRNRVFIISPSGKSLKIPSDLYGLNEIRYKYPDIPSDKNLQKSLKEACNDLISIINNLGVK